VNFEIDERTVSGIGTKPNATFGSISTPLGNAKRPVFSDAQSAAAVQLVGQGGHVVA
jgi:hypothetical protein